MIQRVWYDGVDVTESWRNSPYPGAVNTDINSLHTIKAELVSVDEPYPFYYFFAYSGIHDLDLSDLDVSWVTDFTCCLYGLGELTSCNLDGFDTSNGEIFDGFLGNCFGNNGYTPDVSKLNTSKGKSFKSCFDDWGGTTLDIRGWDFSSCESGGLERMFIGFEDVTKIYMPEKFVDFQIDKSPFFWTESSGTLYYPEESQTQYEDSYFIQYAEEAGYNCVAQ